MARFFNARAALAEIQSNPIDAIRPISQPETPPNRTNRVNRVPPDVEIFEERAAIAEFDGGFSRPQAEDLAARAQGYDNVVQFRAAAASIRSKKGCGHD